MLVVGCDRRQKNIATPEVRPTTPAPVTQTPTTQPIALSVPSSQRATHTIKGGAWVVRGTGSSDILRGLHVRLVKPTAKTADVAPVVEAARQSFKRDIEAETKSRTKVINGATMVDNYPTEIEKRLTKTLAELDLAWSGLSVNNQIPISDLVSIANHQSKTGVPIFNWRRFVEDVASDDTDINGKYEITSIPDGDYFLVSFTNNKVFYIEWAIPVTCHGDMTIDLNNDNSDRVINRKD